MATLTCVATDFSNDLKQVKGVQVRELEISYDVGLEPHVCHVWVCDKAAEVLCDSLTEDYGRYHDATVIYLEVMEYLETGSLSDVTDFEAEEADRVVVASYH